MQKLYFHLLSKAIYFFFLLIAVFLCTGKVGIGTSEVLATATRCPRRSSPPPPRGRDVPLRELAIYWKTEEVGVKGAGWSTKKQRGKKEGKLRRGKMKISGILKHFSHFLKRVGGVDTTRLGLGHKLIEDLSLNQEKAIKIFLASSVGK